MPGAVAVHQALQFREELQQKFGWASSFSVYAVAVLGTAAMLEEGVRDSDSGMLRLVDESYGRSSQPNFNPSTKLFEIPVSFSRLLMVTNHAC